MNHKFFQSKKGEVATSLTVISLGLLVAGIFIGTKIVERGPRTDSKAVSNWENLSPEDWKCTKTNGEPDSARLEDRKIFNSQYCGNGQDAWKQQACDIAPEGTVNTDCPTFQACLKDPATWICDNNSACADLVTQGSYNSSYCNGEAGWRWNICGQGTEPPQRPLCAVGGGPPNNPNTGSQLPDNASGSIKSIVKLNYDLTNSRAGDVILSLSSTDNPQQEISSNTISREELTPGKEIYSQFDHLDPSKFYKLTAEVSGAQQSNGEPSMITFRTVCPQAQSAVTDNYCILTPPPANALSANFQITLDNYSSSGKRIIDLNFTDKLTMSQRENHQIRIFYINRNDEYEAKETWLNLTQGNSFSFWLNDLKDPHGLYSIDISLVKKDDTYTTVGSTKVDSCQNQDGKTGGVYLYPHAANCIIRNGGMAKFTLSIDPLNSQPPSYETPENKQTLKKIIVNFKVPRWKFKEQGDEFGTVSSTISQLYVRDHDQNPLMLTPLSVNSTETQTFEGNIALKKGEETRAIARLPYTYRFNDNVPKMFGKFIFTCYFDVPASIKVNDNTSKWEINSDESHEINPKIDCKRTSSDPTLSVSSQMIDNSLTKWINRDISAQTMSGFIKQMDRAKNK